MSNQAIISKTVIHTATFSGKPDEGLRKNLIAAGYKYDRGRWYHSETDSRIVAEAEFAKGFGG